MTRKPIIGRPPLDTRDVKKNRTFRVSDAVYSDWQARAERLGLTLPGILPNAVERELKRLEKRRK